MDGQVPEEIKHRRTTALIAHAAEIRREILQRMIEQGAEHSVLFESYENGYAYGHTPEFIEVAMESDRPLHAQTVAVRLYETDGTRCLAHPITPPPMR